MSSFRAAPSRKPRIGTSLESSEAIAARLEELERKLERLRALHEAFFVGTERRPPQTPRQELNRLMLEMQHLSIRNAGLRFRFQALSARWTLLTTYWNRTLREIESGTYRRDLQKAYRRIAARGAPLTEAEASALGIPVGRAKAFVDQQNKRWADTPGAGQGPLDAATATATASPEPPRSVPDAAAPTSASGSPATKGGRAFPAELPKAEDIDDDLPELCRVYAEAHKRLAPTGAPAAPPSAERIRSKILPELLRLRARYPTSRFAFRIVEEQGRVVIRATKLS